MSSRRSPFPILLALSALWAPAALVSAAPTAVAASTAAAKAEEPAAVFSQAVKLKDEPVAYAQAISLAFGATFFTEVQVSTNGAVTDLSRLAHDGFYKRELIELLLMSAKSRKPLRELAELRAKKKKALREIAQTCKLDYDAIYEAALSIERVVDRDYLPHFPERRPRPERTARDWNEP